MPFRLLLFSLICFTTLINGGIFGNATLFAFFGYTFIGLVFSATIIITPLWQPQQCVQLTIWPLISTAIVGLYYCINGFVHAASGGTNLHHYYAYACILLLLAYTLAIKLNFIKVASITNIVAWFSLLQSAICVLQSVKVLPSANTLFTVTGSWLNPNVSAMFLVMAQPLILAGYFFSPTLNIKKSGWYIVVWIINIVALVLLQCRTAYIGSFIITGIVLQYQYHWWQFLKQKLSSSILYGGLTIIACCGIFSFCAFKNSIADTEGRWFVWKICKQMFVENPLSGCGYGYFDHDYNLQQAQYFASGLGTKSEIMTAGYVKMSYNELLENLTEGGIIGLLAIIFLACTLLFIKPSAKVLPKNKHTDTLPDWLFFQPYAFAGIVAFFGMSLVNFTIQAIPAMHLFVLYAAVCVANGYAKYQIKLPSKLLISLLPLALYLLIQTAVLGKAYYQCNYLRYKAANLNNQVLHKQMDELAPVLKNSAYYWSTYAQMLHAQKLYQQALPKYHAANKLMSNPEVWIQTGNCYAAIHQSDSALSAYQLAANIQPHRFAPKMALLQMYVIKHDTSSILTMANAIITMPVKVPSMNVNQYKKMATAISNSFNKN